MRGKVLIAGIGNIFLGDDAFGVEVVRRLQACLLPDHVRVVDFGIRTCHLAYSLMEEWDLVILVDAVPGGAKPGTLCTIQPEEEATGDGTALDAHTMNPASVLQLVRRFGGKPGPLLVVGCEPATIEPDPRGAFGLSAPVAAAVDQAVRMIEGLVTSTRTESRAA